MYSYYCWPVIILLQMLFYTLHVSFCSDGFETIFWFGFLSDPSCLQDSFFRLHSSTLDIGKIYNNQDTILLWLYFTFKFYKFMKHFLTSDEKTFFPIPLFVHVWMMHEFASAELSVLRLFLSSFSNLNWKHTFIYWLHISKFMKYYL